MSSNGFGKIPGILSAWEEVMYMYHSASSLRYHVPAYKEVLDIWTQMGRHIPMWEVLDIRTVWKGVMDVRTCVVRITGYHELIIPAYGKSIHKEILDILFLHGKNLEYYIPVWEEVLNNMCPLERQNWISCSWYPNGN